MGGRRRREKEGKMEDVKKISELTGVKVPEIVRDLAKCKITYLEGKDGTQPGGIIRDGGWYVGSPGAITGYIARGLPTLEKAINFAYTYNPGSRERIARFRKKYNL